MSIRVSDQLSSPHPLVEEGEKQLRTAVRRRTIVSFTNQPADGALKIAIVTASFTRAALKIMDTIDQGVGERRWDGHAGASNRSRGTTAPLFAIR